MVVPCCLLQYSSEDEERDASDMYKTKPHRHIFKFSNLHAFIIFSVVIFSKARQACSTIGLRQLAPRSRLSYRKTRIHPLHTLLVP